MPCLFVCTNSENYVVYKFACRKQCQILRSLEGIGQGHNIGKRIMQHLTSWLCSSLYVLVSLIISSSRGFRHYLRNWSHSSKSISPPLYLRHKDVGTGRESQSENVKRYHRPQDDASMCDVTILTCAWALILSEHHSRWVCLFCH